MIWIVAAAGVFVFLGFIGFLALMMSGFGDVASYWDRNHMPPFKSYEHHVHVAEAPVDEYRRAQERTRS